MAKAKVKQKEIETIAARAPAETHRQTDHL